MCPAEPVPSTSPVPSPPFKDADELFTWYGTAQGNQSSAHARLFESVKVLITSRETPLQMPRAFAFESIGACTVVKNTSVRGRRRIVCEGKTSPPSVGQGPIPANTDQERRAQKTSPRRDLLFHDMFPLRE